MTKETTPIPDVLQGLGLSELQLKQVSAYFHARVLITRDQRFILLTTLMMLGAAWICPTLLPDQGDLPFQSLTEIALHWLPLFALLVGALAWGVKELVAQRIDAELATLGMSERALAKVRSLAKAIAITTFFGSRLLKLVGVYGDD